MSIKNFAYMIIFGWQSVALASETANVAKNVSSTERSAESRVNTIALAEQNHTQTPNAENPAALSAMATHHANQTTTVATTQRELLQLPVVGTGKFTYLFWHIYNAKLMTQTGQFVDYQTSSPLILSLTYQRDISMIDFVDATLDQWEHIHGKIAPRHQQWADVLKTIWQDVKQGDTLSCQRLNSSQVEFYLNGNFIGEINDNQFADEFLDIWLSEKTSAPELRRQLLK